MLALERPRKGACDPLCAPCARGTLGKLLTSPLSRLFLRYDDREGGCLPVFLAVDLGHATQREKLSARIYSGTALIFSANLNFFTVCFYITLFPCKREHETSVELYVKLEKKMYQVVIVVTDISLKLDVLVGKYINKMDQASGVRRRPLY